jgi:hypothetical protein
MRAAVAIDLNRRFVECREGNQSDPDLVARFGRTSETLGWDKLLRKRRVVFLAEAGSGKTTELVAQSRAIPPETGDAFYATVEDVGRLGLEGALRSVEREHLKAWRVSGRDAWFFIDSVDEAKNSGVKLRTVVRNIADGIAGCERRAHIVLFGRYTDWEFRRDLGFVRDNLSVPDDQELPPPPTPDELVISTIHREKPKETPTKEDVLVVVMTGLDEARVRIFAAGKELRDVDDFLAQIEDANLWQFARRPLDLDWLVQFWQSHRRLGSLAEMLGVCIRERLHESNIDRARSDDLDVEVALAAVERVAAALIFGRKEIISVPDAEIDLSADELMIDLADVLPDWSAQDRARLIIRAVFDPATFGRARLHNDNQGVVRGYLTARWLKRLGEANLSKRGLQDLLFADVYGVPVIKPSMQETAAWLSLWHESVAQEVVKRNPFLLLTAGDPQTLSRAMRESLLRGVVSCLARGERAPVLDQDSLRRFSRPDLAEEIRRLFAAHANQPEVVQFLLRVIWLGRIADVADLAETAVLAQPAIDYTVIVAGRALMAAGDSAALLRYAAFVKQHCETLPTTVVWDALATIFPAILGVCDTLDILSRIDVTDSGGGLGFDYIGPNMVAKIVSPSDLDVILLGTLSQLAGSPATSDRELTDKEKEYFPLMTAAAQRLLELSPDDQAPVSALDAFVRLGESLGRSQRFRDSRPDLIAQIKKTPQRRKLAFWRYAQNLVGHRMLVGRLPTSIWDLTMLGWSVELSLDDIDWLLEDAPNRSAENERQLAIDAAMMIWRDAGRTDDLRARIAVVVGQDATMSTTFDSWITPRSKPAEMVESENRLAELQRRNALEKAAHDKSWIDFAAEFRNDPTKMADIRPTTDKGADSKIYHLWHLLSNASGNIRYALDTVAPLIGAAATAAFERGLVAHWRAWTPWMRSLRADEQLNQVRNLDSMGIVGITLEAKSRPYWARNLSDDDARRAAQYATLELADFPAWLSDLAREKPAIVRDTLATEMKADLRRPGDGPTFGVLESIARSDAPVVELLAPVAVDLIEAQPGMLPRFLSPLLEIAIRGKGPERDRLKALAAEHARSVAEPESNTLYSAATFTLDAATATTLLIDRMDGLAAPAQAALVQRVLPRVFGGQFGREDDAVEHFPLPSLERLVRLAFQVIRPQDDIVHPTGVVYSPGARDDAEGARGAVFKRIVTTPGRAGFDAITRLQADNGFAVSKERLRELAIERASLDSEMAPWPAGEAFAFERTAETEPRTTRDLQMNALGRIEDMQHDLVHDDYQQGETLAGLPSENTVQRWFSDRMHLKQGRSFSVDREVHVADEKEPDVRLRAKATDANVPIEIKVAESWTLPQLESALIDQLCGKYLRDRQTRHGILLLVHQTPRPVGWEAEDGGMLTFQQVVERLRAKAAELAGASTDAPQPGIAVIDVSVFASSVASRKPKTAKPNAA